MEREKQHGVVNERVALLVYEEQKSWREIILMNGK